MALARADNIVDARSCFDVAEAFADLLGIGRWGLGLADERDAGHFELVRLFGASSPNPD